MSDVLLAQKWNDEDPSGWWVSEKLDGVRAVWRHGAFVSRGDLAFVCPDWFKRKMPAGCVLDGELWGGRGQFQKTVGIVKSSARASEWEFLTYMVFDALEEAPSVSVERRPFEERLDVVRRVCGFSGALQAVPMERCRNRDHLMELLAQVERRGGEGLMLRSSGSIYEHRRSHTLLKVKSFHDDEARVIGHDAGKGRVSGMCGALVCETPDGRRFKVGSGLSDAQRRVPPSVGTVITYRYQELTAANIPRFPTLVGERVDLDWRNICASYVPPASRVSMALKKKHTVLFGDAGHDAGMPDAVAAGPVVPLLKRTLTAEDMKQRGVAMEDLEDILEENVPHPGMSAMKRPKIDERPVCAYGTKCYRSNPLHFIEFSHPWLDQENNEGPAEVASSSSASAAPPPPVVEALGRATAPSSATVAIAEAADVHPTSFQEHLATSSVVPQVTSAVARPSDFAAPPGSSALTSPAVSPATVVASSAATSSTTAGLGLAQSSDVRIIALRNLLGSLLQDASDEDERAHWEHLLKLLEVGPSGSKALRETTQPQPQQQQEHHHHQTPPHQQPAMAEQVHSTEPIVAMGIPHGVPGTTSSGMPPPLAAPLRAAGFETEVPSAEARAPLRMATPSVLEVTGTPSAVPLRPLSTETELNASTLQIGAATSPPPVSELEAPTAVAGAPLPMSSASGNLVAQLRNMGFNDADAAEAAKRAKTVTAAVDWLLVTRHQ